VANGHILIVTNSTLDSIGVIDQGRAEVAALSRMFSKWRCSSSVISSFRGYSSRSKSRPKC
jgi:hypothetical protein